MNALEELQQYQGTNQKCKRTNGYQLMTVASDVGELAQEKQIKFMMNSTGVKQ